MIGRSKQTEAKYARLEANLAHEQKMLRENMLVALTLVESQEEKLAIVFKYHDQNNKLYMAVLEGRNKE